jgi:hypothetical protein
MAKIVAVGFEYEMMIHLCEYGSTNLLSYLTISYRKFAPNVARDRHRVAKQCLRSAVHK